MCYFNLFKLLLVSITRDCNILEIYWSFSLYVYNMRDSALSSVSSFILCMLASSNVFYFLCHLKAFIITTHYSTADPLFHCQAGLAGRWECYSFVTITDMSRAFLPVESMMKNMCSMSKSCTELFVTFWTVVSNFMTFMS